MKFKQIDTKKKLKRLEIFFKEKQPTNSKTPINNCSFYSYLNELVFKIEDVDNHCYLEVGVFVGPTLISAAVGNKASCYGVDNFSLNCFGHPTENVLKENLKKSEVDNVKYFKTGYKEFFDGRTDVDGKKIKIYFYDGNHSYDDQYAGLISAMPCLADEALILVHDTYGRPCDPWNATMDAIRDEEEFTLLQDIPHSDEWPTGIIILKFERKT